MPEILAPGVYIAEVPFEARSIDGVATSTDGFSAAGPLGTRAVTLAGVHAPDWTDHNSHDPGITTLELFAWSAELPGLRVVPALDAAMLHPALVGIVSGLEVGAADRHEKPAVTVSPGLAVGAEGRTIEPDLREARCRTLLDWPWP